ncbi:MAG: C_GCAxxG_C_C family protein [Lachnospiraceae bacterium]|nr:C_GCAxxG_C_C family protein [Lachnospiraceae bacterium]
MDYAQSKYGQKAEDNFVNGYNCTQAVFLAFSDLYQMDTATAARLSSSFGGGMGRLREVCGAVSGMFLVAGMLYGYDMPGDLEGKKEHYARIQQLARAYEEENGSIVCRELLRLDRKRDLPVPEERTAEYYKKRPCKKLVRMAAAIMEQYIEEHPLGM